MSGHSAIGTWAERLEKAGWRVWQTVGLEGEGRLPVVESLVTYDACGSVSTGRGPDLDDGELTLKMSGIEAVTPLYEVPATTCSLRLAALVRSELICRRRARRGHSGAQDTGCARSGRSQ